MSTITPAELAKIAHRHDNIPQDAMIPAPEMPAMELPAKAPLVKSVKWKLCPCHTPSGIKQLTGLILSPGGVLVFRDHTKWIGNIPILCPGSGRAWVKEPK